MPRMTKLLRALPPLTVCIAIVTALVALDPVVPASRAKPAFFDGDGPNGQVAAGSDWPTYGGTLANTRFSRLAAINTNNVSRLRVAWTFQTGFVTPETSFECTPIVTGGRMFVTSPKSEVYALDAETGELVWHFDPRVDLSSVKLCCGMVNRGVAVADGRVYVATLDARLIALEAATGKPVESFGKNGEVKLADHTKGYSETAAPVVAGGKIFVGAAGGEFETRGFFDAYDSATGTRRWRWHTIPSPDEPGGNSWPDNGVYSRGGGAAWMTATVDQENGQVIFGTGNPNPDFDGRERAGDNLYTCSVVSLDIETGKMRWYFQQVKHDLWDYDQSSPPILFDSTVGGKRVQAVGFAGKIGWFYILDRLTGRSLLPMRDIEVPQDPGQATAATQRVPTYPPFVEHKNLFAPPTREGVLIAPGLSGGSEWSPLAYSPQTNLVYVCAVNKPMVYQLGVPNPFGLILGGIAFVPPDVEPAGAFVAIDANTGMIRWRTDTSPHPVGGVLATSGGLLFAGESNGMFDALDSATGKVLWQFRCGAGVNAAPMTYEIKGRQYVAVAAGGLAMESLTSGRAGERNFRRGGTVFVFAVP